MNYQKLNKTCNRFIWFASFMLFSTAILCLGNGGVLNDLDKALVEIEELERKNLLHNPPETTSAIAKREIGLVHNSAGLKTYIKDVEQSGDTIMYTFFATCFLLISLIILKVFVWIKVRRLRKLPLSTQHHSDIHTK